MGSSDWLLWVDHVVVHEKYDVSERWSRPALQMMSKGRDVKEFFPGAYLLYRTSAPLHSYHSVNRCGQIGCIKFIWSSQARLHLSPAICWTRTGSSLVIHQHVPKGYLRSMSNSPIITADNRSRQTDLTDRNPLIRAMSLRVMSSIRGIASSSIYFLNIYWSSFPYHLVQVIVPISTCSVISLSALSIKFWPGLIRFLIVMLALKKATTDLSPYVRKAAANAIPKCYKYLSSSCLRTPQYINKLMLWSSLV